MPQRKERAADFDTAAGGARAACAPARQQPAGKAAEGEQLLGDRSADERPRAVAAVGARRRRRGRPCRGRAQRSEVAAAAARAAARRRRPARGPSRSGRRRGARRRAAGDARSAPNSWAIAVASARARPPPPSRCAAASAMAAISAWKLASSASARIAPRARTAAASSAGGRALSRTTRYDESCAKSCGRSGVIASALIAGPRSPSGAAFSISLASFGARRRCAPLQRTVEEREGFRRRRRRRRGRTAAAAREPSSGSRRRLGGRRRRRRSRRRRRRCRRRSLRGRRRRRPAVAPGRPPSSLRRAPRAAPSSPPARRRGRPRPPPRDGPLGAGRSRSGGGHSAGPPSSPSVVAVRVSASSSANESRLPGYAASDGQPWSRSASSSLSEPARARRPVHTTHSHGPAGRCSSALMRLTQLAHTLRPQRSWQVCHDFVPGRNLAQKWQFRFCHANDGRSATAAAEELGPAAAEELDAAAAEKGFDEAPPPRPPRRRDLWTTSSATLGCARCRFCGSSRCANIHMRSLSHSAGASESSLPEEDSAARAPRVMVSRYSASCGGSTRRRAGRHPPAADMAPEMRARVRVELDRAVCTRGDSRLPRARASPRRPRWATGGARELGRR